MSIEVNPTLFGVGAVLVCGDEFAVVTEITTSERSVKVAGQETFPMETVEKFDLNDWATLIRACREEVDYGLTASSMVVRLCTIETRPGVQLRNYYIEVSNKDLIGRGAFEDEVSPVKWIPLTEVMDARGSLRFRPGVYEVVADYLRYRHNPDDFVPGEYLYTELADQIPENVFRLVEGGFSGKEAVSQWFALRQPSEVSVV